MLKLIIQDTQIKNKKIKYMVTRKTLYFEKPTYSKKSEHCVLK